MTSFEQEVKDHFQANKIQYIDNSAEFKLLDFTITNLISEPSNGNDVPKKLYLEVKEKRQKYNTQNWNMIDAGDETFAFIVDELSCRKILGYAPFSGLLVRNNLAGNYCWFSVLDLFLMPKKRANRQIQKNSQTFLKGKIILDFRNAKQFSSLSSTFKHIRLSMTDRARLYTELNDCYGTYVGEKIPIQGVVRNSGHWDVDINETR